MYVKNSPLHLPAANPVSLLLLSRPVLDADSALHWAMSKALRSEDKCRWPICYKASLVLSVLEGAPI
jgi:hypothetical protein